ncbi:hypothetical protein HPB49_013278 [Dermacentor silvarum]|uniref:Uncharacterized protein n=1 Tax=Dermacentor silvarum TaxID=543639 RepID=A0ACB8C3V1_DERSI|nr:hypothetical protein HPB49_013278 [Dermacentor silvarum]
MVMLSDHRYIEFSFSGMPGVRKKRLTNFARAQILDSLNRSVWFDRVVGCRFSSCLAVELVLAKFFRIYDALHTRNLRAVKPHATSGNAWWTPQLAAERSRVRAVRRRLQRARDPDLRAVFRAQYARTFACYKRNIRRAKDTFDRSLCQELTTRNLFGDPFKLAFAKLSPPTHLPPLLQTDGNLTSSVLSSAALLLRVHVGADDSAEDTEFHRRRSAVAVMPKKTTMGAVTLAVLVLILEGCSGQEGCVESTCNSICVGGGELSGSCVSGTCKCKLAAKWKDDIPTASGMD